MKHFNITTPVKEIAMTLPTTIDEIDSSKLLESVKHVHIADHYSLVGIVYHDTLGAIILARKQFKKGITAGVIPVFIKSGKTDSEFLAEAKCKDKIIIAPTQLSLGHHVVVPTNSYSIDKFIKLIDQDTTIAARYNNNFGKEECYFVEFKIVPNCDIIGFYSDK